MLSEYLVYLLTPFSLIAVVLVMLGTDELRIDTKESTAKSWGSVNKALRASPNLLYTVASIVTQRASMLVGHWNLGRSVIFDVIMIVAYFYIGKILYRQRVKMGHTIKDDEERNLPRDQLHIHGKNERTLGHMFTSHDLHARNFTNLKLKESEFEELILTDLPRIGLVTFITVAYFIVESYGCLQNDGAPEEGITYCYEFTGVELIEKCGNSTCEKNGGYGKVSCNDS